METQLCWLNREKKMARGTGEDGPHPVDRFVGRKVCEKRISLGYNQSDLGRALGLTFQQIQKYEKGANRISASKLWDIARFFKVDIGYFLKARLAWPRTARPPTTTTIPRPAIRSRFRVWRPSCRPGSRSWPSNFCANWSSVPKSLTPPEPAAIAGGWTAAIAWPAQLLPDRALPKVGARSFCCAQ